MKKIEIINNKTEQSYGAKLEDAEATAWIESCEIKGSWGKKERIGIPKDYILEDAYDLIVAINDQSI